MNRVNASTGYSPFQLCFGQSPHTILPLLPEFVISMSAELDARSLIQQLKSYVHNAQDNLLAAKVQQAANTNAYRGPEPKFLVNDQVLLATKHCRRDYMQRGNECVAK
ncbi:hypothetical protein OBBRIDRAFT_712152, partial [Obba rivulosa]